MKAVIVAGGEPVAADRNQLTDADLIVAADAGAAWLAEQGVTPHLLVGDMDSISAELTAALAERGVAIERHPPDKDASDAELALQRAVGAGADEVVIIGALGGPRLDHELANLLLLADESWPETLRPSIVRGGTAARPLRGGASLELRGGVGDLVTLLPLGGDVQGVTTVGLRYRLEGEPLRIGRSRGLSNVIVESPASVSLEEGLLLVIETKKEGEER